MADDGEFVVAVEMACDVFDETVGDDLEGVSADEVAVAADIVAGEAQPTRQQRQRDAGPAHAVDEKDAHDGTLAARRTRCQVSVWLTSTAPWAIAATQ